MPRSALEHVRVDRCVSAERIAATLVELVSRPVPAAAPAPATLVREHATSLLEGDPIANLRSIGDPTVLVCPDCGGNLFELQETKPQRFRCHTGHAFTVRSLQDAQKESTETALWSAIRALKDRETLLRQVATLDRDAGDERRADEAQAEARRVADHVSAIRRLIDAD